MTDDNPQEPRSSVEKFWDKTKNVLNRGGEEFKKVSKIGKIKFDCSAVQRERQRLLSELAEQVCRLVDEKKLKDDDLVRRVEEIRLLTEQIENAQKNIQSISKTIAAGDDKGQDTQPPPKTQSPS